MTGISSHLLHLARFHLLDGIAQAGRFLVALLIDRRRQTLAQLHQLGLGLLVLRLASWHLAAVSRLAVDVFPKRQQLVMEFVVVVGTSQTAGIAKLHELDAANRAGAIQDAGLFHRCATRQRRLFAGRLAVLGIVEVLLGA